MGGAASVEPTAKAISVMRAQVRSIDPPMSPRELYQIGVELESPANLWGVSTPPDDCQRRWERWFESADPRERRRPGSRKHNATASKSTRADPEYRNARVAAFPSQPPGGCGEARAGGHRLGPTGCRVSREITVAAEKAVQTATTSSNGRCAKR